MEEWLSFLTMCGLCNATLLPHKCCALRLAFLCGRFHLQGHDGGFMDRIGRYAQEHGIIRANELYEDDKDNWGD